MATKKTAKKTTAKKAAGSQAAQAPEPMDPAIREVPEPQPVQTRKRNAYALETLRDEVVHLFPETQDAFDISGIDGRGVAHDITFDLTVIPEEDRDGFASLIHLIEDDHRVAQIIREGDQVYVSIVTDARHQDSRDTFGLNDAWMVLISGGEGSA